MARNTTKNKSTQKIILRKDRWGIVSKELEAEKFKLAAYDKTIIPLLGNVKNKNILDYGCGPGLLALTLKSLGAKIKAYDISEEMLRKTAEKIGTNNVYADFDKIPSNYFDFVICNLVLCIVPENEVKKIVKNIYRILKNNGTVYIGFCNPKIFNIPESQLDFRFNTRHKYEENHAYNKIKKEGGYEIRELHRPIEWYSGIYEETGFRVLENIFTPAYRLKGNTIKDFIIFKLAKNKG